MDLQHLWWFTALWSHAAWAGYCWSSLQSLCPWTTPVYCMTPALRNVLFPCKKAKQPCQINLWQVTGWNICRAVRGDTFWITVAIEHNTKYCNTLQLLGQGSTSVSSYYRWQVPHSPSTLTLLKSGLHPRGGHFMQTTCNQGLGYLLLLHPSP